MISFLTHWEPLWLLIVLVAEFIFTFLSWRMLKIEFEYDKKWNERQEARETRRRERSRPLEKEMD